MSEDLGTITLRTEDAALKAATAAIFQKLDEEHRTHQRVIGPDEVLADFHAISAEAAALLRKPLPKNDETQAWLAQEVEERHAQHFELGWEYCRDDHEPIWDITESFVDSLTPEEFGNPEECVSITWMHGEQSHVFVPFMTHVFKLLGFTDIRTDFDYEDGDPFGPEV